MRSKEQILAEVLDSLIQQGDGRTPCEIAPLAEIATRLHNECPDADPAFLQRLQARLQAEWSPPGWAQLLRATLSPLLPRPWPRLLLRGAASTLAAGVLLVALLAAVPALRTARADLARRITIFQQARVEQWPAQPVAPARPLEASRSFSSIAEAQAAASFPLRIPTYLPGGLAPLSVRSVDTPGVERFILQCTSPDAGLGAERQFVVIQEYRVGSTSGDLTLTLSADLESVERLQVAGRSALWTPRQADPMGPSSMLGQGYGLLVQDGDVLIQLFTSLGRDESVRIAESMFR